MNFNVTLSTGIPGKNGNTVLSGSGMPSPILGVNGDFYLDTAASRIYGPKTAGAWGSGTSLIGATGAPGTNGTNGTNGIDGKSVLNGSGAPSAGLGNNGDFYINTSASTIYGPKTAGAWGSGTSLIGPAGANGTNGSAGPNTVTTATTTNITGLIKGNGATIAQAILGTDYQGVIKYALITEEFTQNTAAGTFTAGSWVKRSLNTKYDPSGFVTLSSNVVTLSAGTYRFQAHAPAYRVDNHQIRLQNTTDTISFNGTSEASINTTDGPTRSFVSGEIIITGSKNFELQHQCITTKTSNGLGTAGNFSTEKYSVLEIVKII